MTLRLNQLEQELRDGELSPHSEQWLAASQLTADQLLPLLKPLPEVVVPTVHLYYCDHLGTPLALLNQQGEADWQAEFDPWGNQVDGRNPKKLYQPIRMQGQHYDEETGLHYNRHRYYDPMLGRYITQDPIGLAGGINIYSYSLDPLLEVDPLGLATIKLDGKKIQVHSNDVDPWPSNPHGHIYDENQVIDKKGQIYNKSTGKELCSLSKKSLVKWTEFLVMLPTY